MPNPLSPSRTVVPRGLRRRLLGRLTDALARKSGFLGHLPKRLLRPMVRKFLQHYAHDRATIERWIRAGTKAGVMCGLLLGLIGEAQGATPQYIPLTGAFNSLSGVDVGFASAPRFVDIDGDGDLDMFTGSQNGTVRFFRNDGSTLIPQFGEIAGLSNPFDFFDVGGYSAPTFVDIDGDGDMDAFVGTQFGAIQYFSNIGDPAAPVFMEIFDTANPFTGTILPFSVPAFVDIDGNGAKDAFIGTQDGTIRFFRNTGSASTPVMSSQTGAANPFNGVDLGTYSAPSFVDMDGDGDFDAVVGAQDGDLHYFENTGTVSAPVFEERAGALNPFTGVNVIHASSPAFCDINADGDFDVFVGRFDGTVDFLEAGRSNPTVDGTINMGFYTEGDAPLAILSDLVITDVDSVNLAGGTVQAWDFGAGDVLQFTDQLGITGSYDNLTGLLTLTGTATVADYQTALRSVTYRSTSDDLTIGNTDNSRSWVTTVTDDQGLTSSAKSSMLGLIGMNDNPALTGLVNVTVLENVVKAAPQPVFFLASVTDPDSPDLNSGTLTVAYSSGGGAEDQLSIRDEGASFGQIGFSAGVVTYSSLPIATIPASGPGSGQNGQSLVVTFNTPQASLEAATALLRNILYQNTSDTPVLTRTAHLTVTDGDGGTSPGVDVVITVNPSNDQPTLDPIPSSPLLSGGAGAQNVGLTGISAGSGDSGQTITVTATSSNPGIVPDPLISYNSPDSTGSLQYTPVPGVHGAATITVTVTDDGGTADAGVDTITRTFDVTVDSTTPTVTGITSSAADGTYGAGDTIPIQISFSENVVVTGMPQLSMETGDTDRTIDYVSGSGTDTLTFSYVIQDNDSATDLDYFSTAALGLNGGTIADVAGNAASLTLSFPGTAGSLGANKDLSIDGTVIWVSQANFGGAASKFNFTGGDTPLLNAVGFSNPEGVVLGSGVNAGFLFVANQASAMIAKVNIATGETSDFATTQAESALTGLAFDPAGNLYIANSGSIGAKIYVVGPGGGVASSFGVVGSLGAPAGLAVDGNGYLYVADSQQNHVAKINIASQSIVTTFPVGASPRGLAFDNAANLYVANNLSDTISRITPGGTVSTFASGFNEPIGLAFDRAGNLYSVNRGDGTVSKISPGGVVSPFISGLSAPQYIASMPAIIPSLAPTVVSIVRAGPNPSNAASVQFTVTFSAPVTGVDDADILGFATGLTGASLASVTGSGTTYTVTMNTGTGDGTIRIAVSDDDSIVGSGGQPLGGAGAGNGDSGGGEVYTIDKTPPTVSISAPSPPATTGGPVTFTVTYDDANFGLSQMTAAGILFNETGTVSFRFTVSEGHGATRTIILSDITGNGTIPIGIGPGTASDTAGNRAPDPGFSAAVIVDNSPPVVTISAPSATTTIGGPITYTITYYDPLLNSISLTAADIAVNSTLTAAGSVTSVTGSGSTRTVTIDNISGDGTLSISLAAGTATDDLGHTALATGPSDAFTVTGAPQIASVTPPANNAYRAGQALNFTLNFSQTVTVTGVPSIPLTIDAQARQAVYVSGSGSSALLFAYTVQAGENDPDGIAAVSPIALNGGTIQSGAAVDASLAFTPPNTTGVLVDTLAPAAPVITGISGDTGESASDRLTSDTTLVLTGTAELATQVAISETGVGTLGTVAANALGQWVFDHTGTTLTPGTHTFRAVATDAAGNVSAASADFVVTIDTTAPTITGIVAPPDGRYGRLANLDFTLTFSEPVFFDISGGTPYFTANVGGTAKQVQYVSGNGSDTITFRFSVAAPDTDVDGIQVSSPINPSSGTIRDEAGNDAVLTFTPPDTSGILVDSTDAALLSVTGPANNTYDAGALLDFTVTYDENVLVNLAGGTPRIGLTVGTTTRQAAYISGSGSTALIFRHVVVPGDLDVDGIVAIEPIDLNGGTITDLAGNNAQLNFTLPNTSGVKVDALAPGIISVTPPANGSYRAGQNLDFVLGFSENVTITGGIPFLNLTVGSTTRSAAFLTGNGTSALTFRYTVQAGETDANGIAMGSAILLNGATIRNGASQDATLTFTPPNTSRVRVDTTAPAISSVTGPAGGTYIAGQNLNFTVNFGEAVTVTVTGTPTLALTIGSTARVATYLSGSGSTALVFRHTVLAGDNDNDGIASASPVALSGGTIQDVAGNNATLTFTPPNTSLVRVDTLAPGISSVTGPASGSYRGGQDLDVTVNYSESVVVDTSQGPPQLNLTVGTGGRLAVYVSGSGSAAVVFRYTVSAGDTDGDGIAVVSPITLLDATIKDAAGNNAGLTFTPPNTTGVLVDTTVPAITSVTPPGNATYSAGQNLDFTVNYGEPVTVGGTPRIGLTIGATVRNANYLSGSGTSALVFRYAVQAGEFDNDGIVSASPVVLNGGTIRDAAGNNGLLTFTPPVTTGVLVDALAPGITSVTGPANGSYRAGQNLDFVLGVSEAVTVSGGTPSISLTIGAASRMATLLSGSGTATLTFRHTVLAGDADANGIAVASAITLNGATIRNGASQDATLTFTPPNTASVLVDTTVPAITSVTGPSAGAYAAGQPLDFTVNFDEAVTVDTTGGAPSIGLTIGSTSRTATYLSGSGTAALVFRHTVLAGDNDANGIAVASPVVLNSGTIRDLAGNDATLTFTAPNTGSVLVDNLAPTFSIGAPSPSLTRTGPVSFVVTYSGADTITLGPGDVNVHNTGNAGYISPIVITGSGNTRTVTINNISGNGTLAMSLDEGTARDSAGNLAAAAGQSTAFTVDNAAPAIASVAVPANGTYGSGDALDFTVTYGENVIVSTAGGTPRIGLTVGSTARFANYVSGSGTSALLFRHTVEAGDFDGDGIASTTPIDLDGGTMADAAGNNAGLAFTAPDTSGVLVDALAPGITSVTGPANGSYRAGQSLDFILGLSEAVTVSGGTPSISLTIGVASRTATLLSGSGSATLTFRHTVLAGDTDGDGIAAGSVIVLNGATIRNGASQDATLTFTAPNTATVLVDTTVPAITSVTGPSASTYIAGQNLNFTVNLGEVVTVDTTGGTPSIGLTIGSTSRSATYLSGSGTAALVFRHTVLAGDNDANGIAVTSPVVLNSGTILDAAGNDATLAFTPPDTSAVLVDTTAPAISSVTGPATGSYRAGQNLDFTVNYSEAVVVDTTLGPPVLDLTVGAGARTATYLSGSGSSAVLFRYTVAAGDTDGDGIASASPLRLGDATIKDAAGNNAGLAFTAPGTSGVLVDTTAPAITSVTGPGNGTYTGGQHLDFTVNYSEAVSVATAGGTPGLTLVIGSNTRTAGYLSGGGASALLFRYVVQEGEFDSDGIMVSSPAGLNDGTILDAAGNAAGLAFAPPVTTAVLVDATSPVVISVVPPVAGFYRAGQNLDFSVTFNFPVNVLGTPSLTLAVGAATRPAAYVSGSGSATLLFRHTVQAGDNDADGIAVAPSIALNGGSLKNGFGTDATLAFTPPVTSAVQVDTTHPTISLSTPTATLAKGGPVSYTVTYADANFDASTLAPANVTLNRTGSANASTVSIGGSGANRTVTLSGITGDGTLGLSLAANTASDLAGNQAPAAGPGVTFTVDNTAPAAPVITGINQDTGVSSSDRLTRDGTLIVSGQAEAGGVVRLTHSVNGLAGTVTANAGGLWSVDYQGTTLGEGTHTFTAVVTDAAGNASANSAPLVVTVDTTAPAVSGLAGPAAGAYGPARVLDFTVTFTQAVFVDLAGGTPFLDLQVGSFRRPAVYVAGSGTTALVFRYTPRVDDTGTGVTADQPVNLSGGTIRDAAGNDATGTPPVVSVPGVVFDAIPPVVLISAPSVPLTRHGPVTYRVSYRDANFYSSTLTEKDLILNRVGTATGVMELVDQTDPLADYKDIVISDISGDGTLSLSVKAGSASDRAGNSSLAAGPGPAVVVDNTAPVAPVLTGVSQDTGVSGTDQNTSDPSLLLTGTAEPGSVVTVTRELTGTLGQATAAANGQWTYDYQDTTLPDGTYGFTAVAVDAAGNASAVSAILSVVVDTVAPVVTVGLPSTPIVGAGGSVSYGVGYVDGYFDASTLTLADITLVRTGTADGSVAVTGEDPTRTVTIANVSGTGTLAFTVAPGTGRDKAGNTSAGAISATVRVDGVIPSAPVITTLEPTAGGFGTEQITRETHPTLRGKADAGVTVLLYLDEVSGPGLTAGLVADMNGNWSYQHTATALSDGPHTFLARGRDTGGNLSAVSAPFLVTVDTVAPDVTLSGPSVAVVVAPETVVTFTARFTDAHLAGISVTASDLILNVTGTVRGTVLAVSGFADERTVTVGGLAGAGTLGLSLRAGTATDLAGNTASAAGPSATARVNLVSLSATPGAGGGVDGITIHGTGLPGSVYEVQATESLNPANWVTVQVITVGPDGLIEYQDTAPAGHSRFYRVLAR